MDIAICIVASRRLTRSTGPIPSWHQIVLGSNSARSVASRMFEWPAPCFAGHANRRTETSPSSRWRVKEDRDPAIAFSGRSVRRKHSSPRNAKRDGPAYNIGCAFVTRARGGRSGGRKFRQPVAAETAI